MITKVKYSDRKVKDKINNISFNKTPPHKDITEKILKDYSDSIKFDNTLNRYIIHKDIEIDNIRYEPIKWYFDKDVELKEGVTIKPKRSCNGFFFYINGDFYWYGLIDLTNRGGKLDKRPPMTIDWENMEIKTNSAFIKDRRLDFNDNYDFHHGGDSYGMTHTGGGSPGSWNGNKGEPGSVLGGGSGATWFSAPVRYSGQGGATYVYANCYYTNCGAGNWNDENLSYHGVGGSLFIVFNQMKFIDQKILFRSNGLQGSSSYGYGPGGGSGSGYLFIKTNLISRNNLTNYNIIDNLLLRGGSAGTYNGSRVCDNGHQGFSNYNWKGRRESSNGSYTIINKKNNTIISNDYHATLDIELNK